MRKILLTTLLLASAAAPAMAREIHSSGTITGSNGRVYQHQGSTSFGQGYMNHQSALTGPNGNSVSRDANTSWSDGNYNRSVTYTGPNGQSGGYSSTGTYGTSP